LAYIGSSTSSPIFEPSFDVRSCVSHRERGREVHGWCGKEERGRRVCGGVTIGRGGGGYVGSVSNRRGKRVCGGVSTGRGEGVYKRGKNQACTANKEFTFSIS